MIYFSWCEEEENFSDHLNNKEDEKVFHLEIFQKEKEYARALISISERAALQRVGQQKWMWISWENEETNEVKPLFKGVFSGLIKETKDGLSQLELVARPSDAQDQLRHLQDLRKEQPSWDELFVREDHRDDPGHFFDGSLKEFYWDRLSHQVRDSDLFEGNPLNLGHRYARESLRLEQGDTPYASIRMNVHAQWVQRDWALMNIFSRIARQFKQGFINSFTGIDFTSRWPKSGKKLGRSGIRVVTSALDEFKPFHTGLLNVYPNHAGPYYVDEGDKVILPRYWYRGKLLIEWLYKQKRHETLTFDLENSLQASTQGGGNQKVMDITLQNIYPPGDAVIWHPKRFYKRGKKVVYEGKIYEALRGHGLREVFDETLWRYVGTFHAPLKARRAGSFFLTPRGRQVAESAMLLARRELAKSSRAVRIHFRGAWEDLSEVTTDHQIFLKDDRLPRGQARGKVVSYKIVANGKSGERFVDVEMACAIGSRAHVLNETGEGQAVVADPQVMDPGVLSDGEPILLEDMAYFPFDDQRPTQGIVNTDLLRGCRLVRGVQIKNTPEDQLRALSHIQTSVDLSRVMSVNKTTVRVHFFDLRTQPCLHHKIQVRMQRTWAPPAHIELE